ncbi:MAG: molybdopterin-dependent oxidoreductase [Candidatus Rokubacteria bacterium]|nr:molybdopterin oxidoreductase [Chloroflexota bacterium]MBM4443430.1 molybdopterin-dependent oxidoreductase [Candidatus Rokubacteria bacterium]
MVDTAGWSRRTFLRRAAGAGLGLALAETFAFEPWLLEASEPVVIGDPFKVFPSRDWERAYRDLFKSDSSFIFTCAPNDTHNCLLRAHVKNGVVVRIGPTYGYGKAEDLHGNRASHRWDPRCCQKGLALARRFYGDRRVQGAMVREGFKQWADAGFPRDAETGKPQTDLTKRGADRWLKVGWDEAFDLAAKAYVNVATTYAGAKGAELLRKQGYDPDMIAAMEEAGTRAVKMRGGMPLLGITRIFGFYRFANMLALLDDHVRKVGPDKAKGSRGWDNYAWHTDLPPGHPMVTGQQTIDHDLFAAEYATLVVTFGMNWISTKMPDGHWLAEARLKGTRIITVTTDYQSTSNRADEVIMIRPGTDAALALGCVQYLFANRLADEGKIKEFTDLPLLVRMDSKRLLAASDIEPGYRPAPLSNFVQVLGAGQTMPSAPNMQGTQYVTDALRQEWGDFVVWDARTNGPKVVTRDQVGTRLISAGADPALLGSFNVRLVNGQTVAVRPVYDLLKQYLDDNFDAQSTSEITWAPKEAIASLATQIAKAKGTALLTHGMGPNHYFNADLKDRALLLLAAVTDNIGQIGGNAGSYAGNYRGSVFNGIPQYVAEDPFNQELDGTRPARTRVFYKTESAHYYNYGDRPLRVGNKNFTGASHMPTPTKIMHFGNSNSILGNAKWHHDVVHNTLPKIDAIFCNEWWWTASCEYADIVFGVDSWAETKAPDATGSCTNPFVQLFPRSPLKRIFDTRGDIEVLAGIAKRLGEITGDRRMIDHWKFVHDGKAETYLQRIFDASTTTRGYRFDDLHAKALQGIPALMNFRTYPRQIGWEQRQESKPWYNRTGRLEFYRDEAEWLEHGENLPVWREPIDATFHEPNAILGKPHPAINPQGPERYGLKVDDLSTETRQVRNVVKPWSELKVTKHPLTAKDSRFKFIFITPKYRHGAHTTPVDLDWMGYLFGPYGDMYRHDRRKPWVGESYLEIHPKDAKALGIEDGDYVWFDGDPEDRPYRGWKSGDAYYDVARGMARARFNNAMQPGVTRMWFHMYVATKGSVRGQKERADGLAKNPETNYQSYFRHGSHQSGTRAWLKPTLMTDSMVRKPYFGQQLGKGFEGDVHSVVGAPKESFIRIEKAEPGGFDGNKLWRPAREGLRPTYESDVMKRYLSGGFVT